MASSDDTPDVPLEGFDPLMARLANLEDRLTQLAYITGRNDPSTAPSAARPVMPHRQRQRELKAAKAQQLSLQLIPEGGE